MKKVQALLYLLSISYLISGQSNEKILGYSIYNLISNDEPIEYYVYNPNAVENVFIYIQGTSKNIKSDAFYWYSDSLECCYGGILPKKYVKEISKTHAVVFIAKPYIPSKINIDRFKKPQKYIDRDYTYYRVWQANQVIKDIKQKKIIKNIKTLSVFGTSEGAVVAGKLASENPEITHVGMGSVGFYNGVVFESIAAIRRKIQRQEISDLEGQNHIDSILNVYEDILNHPKSKEKKWFEESYLWHSNQLETSVENFLKIEIPIYVSIGTRDEKTPIETTDILRMEFLKKGKNNLYFYPCIGCNHNLEILNKKEGKQESKLIDVIQEFLRFTINK